LWIIDATSRAWSGRITVTTVPRAPARAVHPDRCRFTDDRRLVAGGDGERVMVELDGRGVDRVH
jgi:hypothetical protein